MKQEVYTPHKLVTLENAIININSDFIISGIIETVLSDLNRYSLEIGDKEMDKKIYSLK